MTDRTHFIGHKSESSFITVKINQHLKGLVEHPLTFTGPSTGTARGLAMGKPASGFFKNQFNFLVAGGQGSPTVEVLKGAQWVTSNIPSLPMDIWASCMTYRSPDTLFVVAGVQSKLKIQSFCQSRK